MPNIDWNMLCKDWQHQGQGIELNQVEPKTLYYYSYGSGDIRIAPIQRFDYLRHMLVSVSIRFDEEYGWIIFPRNYHSYFPAPDTMVTVYIGQRKSKFVTINAERKLAVEMIPMADGEWEKQFHMQQVFMLYSMESPDLLVDWLDQIVDVAGVIRDSLAPSIFAFMEIRRNGEYILHPDLLSYQKHIR